MEQLEYDLTTRCRWCGCTSVRWCEADFGLGGRGERCWACGRPAWEQNRLPAKVLCSCGRMSDPQFTYCFCGFALVEDAR